MPDELTPEVLARIETVDEQTREAATLYLWDEGIVRPEHLARQVIDALVDDGWRPSGPALLSGVRSLEAENAELRDRLRAAEAEVAKRDEVIEAMTASQAFYSRLTAVEARAAAAEAVIAEAPHGLTCAMNGRPDDADCDCWKSRYRAGADQ